MSLSINKHNCFLLAACLLICESAICELLSGNGFINPLDDLTARATLNYQKRGVQVLESNSSDTSGHVYQTKAWGRIFSYELTDESLHAVELSPVLHNGETKVFSLENNEVYEEYPGGTVLLSAGTEDVMVCKAWTSWEACTLAEYRLDRDPTQHIDIRCGQQEELNDQQNYGLNDRAERQASIIDPYKNIFYFLVESDDIHSEEFLLVVSIDDIGQVSIKKILLSRDKVQALLRLSKEHTFLLHRISYGHPREISVIEEKSLEENTTLIRYRVEISEWRPKSEFHHRMFKFRITDDARLIWIATQPDASHLPALQLGCWPRIARILRFPFCCCGATSHVDELFLQYSAVFEQNDPASRNTQRIAHLLEQYIADSKTLDIAYKNIAKTVLTIMADSSGTLNMQHMYEFLDALWPSKLGGNWRQYIPKNRVTNPFITDNTEFMSLSISEFIQSSLTEVTDIRLPLARLAAILDSYASSRYGSFVDATAWETALPVLSEQEKNTKKRRVRRVSVDTQGRPLDQTSI